MTNQMQVRAQNQVQVQVQLQEQEQEQVHLAANPIEMPTAIVTPGSMPLSLCDFAAVAHHQSTITVDEAIWPRVDAARALLHRCIAENRLVYGVTTGFGPLADRMTPASRIEELQRNLIYHLASGVGAPLPYAEARGLMLARLQSILAGASGASRVLIESMVACLNAGLAAIIPQKGTVGASGDLTPSAHMALALMGEGAFFDRQGAIMPAAEALALIGVTPYTLKGRDGLALVNGTSAMTAIAALNANTMAHLTDWALRTSAAHAEVMHGLAEAWHPALSALRPHIGQKLAQERLVVLTADSERMRRERVASRFLSGDMAGPLKTSSPQDPYTIRCVPQVLGAVIDVAMQHDSIVQCELNAVTDNPVFTEDEPFAIHGGNFFGQHVAFAADHLANAASMIAVLSERQIARITDEKLSGLPAFLQPFETGLQSGLMGAQVTASALVAEIRTRSTPASMQSIPTNANNQDVVSMGTIAARRCRDILDDASRVLAIQMMALAQAIDIIGEDSGFSGAARALHQWVRIQSPMIVMDRPLGAEIEAIASLLRQERLPI